MVQRTIVAVWGLAVLGLMSARPASGDELMYGCWSRPACGKVCKLVCETTTLTAVGYGCECETICIPGPSRAGRKHCAVTCCVDSVEQGCPPKIEFCWYDWFACGCAKPRTVKVLTKFQAEKEVCWYHWEVVDGCDCGCPVGCDDGGCTSGCQCVYKPAPLEAQIGDVLKISPAERAELASFITHDGAPGTSAALDPRASDRDAGQTLPAASPPVLDHAPQATGPALWRYMTKSLWSSAEQQ